MSVELEIILNLLHFSYVFLAENKLNQAIFILVVALLTSNICFGCKGLSLKSVNEEKVAIQDEPLSFDLEESKFVQYMDKIILITQHGKNIYSIGYSLNVKLTVSDEIKARSSLREINQDKNSSSISRLIQNKTLTHLGIGGNLTDDDHLWAYFHNCANIEDAEELVPEALYFSGNMLQIHSALIKQKCSGLKIVYGAHEWPPATLNLLLKNNVVTKLTLQVKDIEELLNS